MSRAGACEVLYSGKDTTADLRSKVAIGETRVWHMRACAAQHASQRVRAPGGGDGLFTRKLISTTRGYTGCWGGTATTRGDHDDNNKRCLSPLCRVSLSLFFSLILPLLSRLCTHCRRFLWSVASFVHLNTTRRDAERWSNERRRKEMERKTNASRGKTESERNREGERIWRSRGEEMIPQCKRNGSSGPAKSRLDLREVKWDFRHCKRALLLVTLTFHLSSISRESLFASLFPSLSFHD